ncbi:MAG: Leucine-rich repeat (LRR) protein [Phenylobacterium sp.]|jgi:Leucine-rich repeat (LRR) protein
MTSNSTPQFHSGSYLQKLRELEGLSIIELAQALSITSTELMAWEHEGIPERNIKACSQYFEVSDSLFSTPVASQATLTRLVESHRFPQNAGKLQALLQHNQSSQSPILDLSGLGLSEIPVEVFTFSWITRLNISNNNLKHIPADLLLLPQLEILDIANNLLAQIPAIVSASVSLKQFIFNGNPLNLQPELLNSAMSLEAYCHYLADASMTMVVLDTFTAENLQNFEKLRQSIEQTQSVFIAKVGDITDFVTRYQQISCIVYITKENDPNQLIGQAKTLLQQKPSLILFVLNKQTNEYFSTINQQLLAALPQSQCSLTLVNSNEDFVRAFDDIQKRLAYENSLPQVKFKRLILNNIGVYEHLDLTFDAELTVLVGLNGAGKTTIIKALALATLGPELAEADSNTAASLLRIIGKKGQQTLWQPHGSIELQASVNGVLHQNTINISNNVNSEKVIITGDRFEQLFDADGHLINLMLSIGEQRNTSLKTSYNPVSGIYNPKAKDLLPAINGEEQACIAHFSAWLGNLAHSVSQGEIDKQQMIDVSFEVFSALMHESIKFEGMTSVKPLELWVSHQEPAQTVPLRLASQGYQAVMGWVGYIIQRMFEAYADALQPLKQSAIIIIDEIDQLLHVKWQQRILNILAKTFFPNTQWIVTTHSPVVVAGLDQAQVIQLLERDGKQMAEPNSVDLWLWQYGDVASQLFGLMPEQPKEQEALLEQAIAKITAIPKAQWTTLEYEQLSKLELRLEKVQNSRAYIDETYAQRQRLQRKEQELSELIEQLKQVKD